MNENIQEIFQAHRRRYPKLKAEDVFKLIYQSSFGCEHLVTDEKAALEYIKCEYDGAPKGDAPRIENLYGDYARVHLSVICDGLKPETLARLFVLSSKREEEGRKKLLLMLDEAKGLGLSDFDEALERWQEADFAPIHHSEEFRCEYRPAYRVIAKRYAELIPVFCAIDSRALPLTVAVEGGSASGKSTLADILQSVYDCNVFHADDFFLRPEQRTPERFAEIGGNLDRERFFDEIVTPLSNNEAVSYVPFDCSTQSLGERVRTEKKDLNVVEGVYSMHPYFGKYYGLSVFLDIDSHLQKKRITVRNHPRLAERFFNEWIPLENKYFSHIAIKEQCDLVIKITE